MKKLAVIDLLAHYPPRGGACVDLFQTFGRLASKFNVKIFGVSWPGDFPRGEMTEPPPLSAEIVRPTEAKRESVVSAVMERVLAWRPDAVFIADGWTLKPWIITAAAERFPTVVRYYAYETLCPRNNEFWLFDRLCENNALADCGRCLKCAAAYAAVVREKKGGKINPLIDEADLADIWRGDYLETVTRSIKAPAELIVYNSFAAGLLAPLRGDRPAHVIPGGVDLDFFNPAGKRPRSDGLFNVLVFGRMDDPAKGAVTAVEAGKILSAQIPGFSMTITRAPKESYPWLEETGWLSQTETAARLRNADCAVTPSLWPEAFGMTWAESMASGVPVAASGAAGPAEYIRDGVNGRLFTPGDAKALSAVILDIYENPGRAAAMAAAALEFVRKNLTWDAAAQKTGAVIEAVLR
jgi:glycosyltransferase involved in cell wall biosynthesis